MLTPSRLEEVACWMRVNGITAVNGVSSDSIILSVDDMTRLAPNAKQTERTAPFYRVDYAAVVDGQSVTALRMDFDAYHAHQNR